MDRWFSRSLIDWYKSNKRDLPWRNEKDPYKIWLSEVILQQTQVAQGLNYYLKFVQKYPTVKHLAQASEDEVLKLWQGLGYYSRARNLHGTAKVIDTQFKGQFPDTYAQIRDLKGIGDYTAAAIASFAYDLPHAVIDGNVYRVLSRVFGIKTPIDSGEGKKEFQKLATQLLNKKLVAEHNQAIMEFGALNCRPTNPACVVCVFKTRCYALQTSTVSEFPIKAKKNKIRLRYFNYLVIFDQKGRLLLNRRAENDIWQGLYEFELIESTKEIAFQQLSTMTKFKNACPGHFQLLTTSKKYKHVLSHQHLFSIFYVIRLETNHSNKRKKTTIKNLDQFAMPRLIEKFLDDCELKEII
ncbi:MAG: A/G-specific adenine glycosylase [bacterium]|nr:A/G-specific adenine glycosylase [bacterium]